MKNDSFANFLSLICKLEDWGENHLWQKEKKVVCNQFMVLIMLIG